MITRLVTPERERIFDGEVSRFVEASVIPCHRCGVCCERWQPLVSPEEQQRLAAHLSLTEREFVDQYTTAYPFDDGARLLRRTDRGCIFLRWDADGRSACSVHPARPDACRDWLAGLHRRECVDGLARFGDPARPLPLAMLYPAHAEREAFVLAARGGEGEGCDGG